MKKLILLLLVLALLPVGCFADLPDISGLSFDELIQLNRQVRQALWASDEWKEVKVPAGVYKIGEDIPSGQWSIQATSGSYVYIAYGSSLDPTGTKIGDDSFEYFGAVSGDSTDDLLHQLDIILADGHFIELHGTVFFYRYTKKLDFSFD